MKDFINNYLMKWTPETNLFQILSKGELENFLFKRKFGFQVMPF